jgi:hypothetical protein
MVFDPKHDPFAEFKNPDGTYNGVKLMAMMSGLSEEEVKRQWALAKYQQLWEKNNARKKD